MISFVDISNTSFDPGRYNRTMQDFMGSIHAQLADGSFVTGVEVFRLIYQKLGFAFVVKLSRLPLIRHVLDAAYVYFAKHRITIGNFFGRKELTSRNDKSVNKEKDNHCGCL